MSKQNGVVFVKMGAAIELESFQTISRMNLYGDVAIGTGAIIQRRENGSCTGCRR